jgi:hypothetical protein
VSDPIAALISDWDSTVVAIARSTARRFGGIVQWEDVAQELRLWWLQNPKRVTKYLAEDEEDQDTRAGTKKLMRALSLEASGYCQVEKARHLGYRVEDLFFYNTGALREILPLVFDYECWVQLGQRASDENSTRTTVAPNEGNNLVAALADVRRGLDLVGESDRDLLVALHRDGFSEAELAGRYGVTLEALNKRHDRALARLRDALGGERPPMHEGPGSRRVISNRAAQAALDV